MTPEQLNAIEARRNAATRGPWYAHATDDDYCMNARYVGLEPCEFRHDGKHGMGADCDAPENVIAITLLQFPAMAMADENDENTLFIAHSWDDIGDLVAEVRRLREKLTNAEALALDLGGSRCEDCGRVVWETPIHDENGSYCLDCYERWPLACVSCSYRTNDVDADSCPECGGELEERAGIDGEKEGTK